MLVALYFFIITRDYGDIIGNVSHITDSIINIIIIRLITLTTLELNYYSIKKV